MRLDEEARDGIALGLGDIAVEAGRLLQGFEQRREFRTKADGSPTTPADLAAEELILRPSFGEAAQDQLLGGEVRRRRRAAVGLGAELAPLLEALQQAPGLDRDVAEAERDPVPG